MVEEGDILSTLSDNEVMWVYFNVPEAQYLDYRARMKKHEDEMKIQLQLANGETFPQPGKIGAIEAEFNNETGNIPFRADFDNPEGLLRHGQTGTVLVQRPLNDAIVIPQRATYEILARRYVYVVEPKEGETHQPTGHGIVRQREIVVEEELEDIFVVKKGLGDNDRIVFEGIGQVRDGDEVEYELRPADEILANTKQHAE